MHIGHTAIFQSPNQAVSDYQIYREDMALAKAAADLGFHYELLGDHFKNIKNYEHYQQQAATYDENGVVDLFLSMQVYGTPAQCYAKVKAMHEMFDICGNVSAFKFAGMPFADAPASQRVYAKEVMPELRKLGPPAPFDSDEIIAPAFMAKRKLRAA
ncbi:MAG: hypothetical protein HYX63_02985 [Gammaproteobacteria bacterium]|nr:hypothetical protein [Gammaproteobacteria bacterium]